MSKTIDVPRRGKKWRRGALVRDLVTHVLYRVTSAPILYHEDALPMQRVSKVRQVPDHWRAVLRLLEIMEQVRRTGTHTPMSRGAGAQSAEAPPTTGESVRWVARRDPESYASYPSLTVCGDQLLYDEPIYDDAPIVVWLQDAELAAEAARLIAQRPSLCAYPAVRVRT